MPIYEFKCPVCEKCTEVVMSFGTFGTALDKTVITQCSNKKCNKILHKKDQVINFAGCINMNASQMGINQRSYNNKKGGPHGIVGKKVIGPTGL